jgi:hypothetical protein
MNTPSKWQPQSEDAINLSEIRWYVATLEKLLLEMYWTNRRRWPDIKDHLKDDLEDLIAKFKESRPGADDEDDCPDGQTKCSDGFCKPVCDDLD